MATKMTQIPLFEPSNIMGKHIEVARMACSASKFKPLADLPVAVRKPPAGKLPPLVIGWRLDRGGE